MSCTMYVYASTSPRSVVNLSAKQIASMDSESMSTDSTKMMRRNLNLPGRELVNRISFKLHCKSHVPAPSVRGAILCLE